MKNTLKFVSSLVLVSLFTIGANFSQTVTDIDGNVYNTVTIGTQVWMKENLKVTRYSNGDTIPFEPSSVYWSNLYTGARCYYDNDSASYAGIYGCLYNWYAAHNPDNICPEGWHVPTDNDWHKLVQHIDPNAQLVLGTESSTAGGKLKDTTSLWQLPNNGATNSTGFTGLPGGFRNGYYYDELGTDAYWWTATKLPGIYPIYRTVSYENSSIVRWGLIHQAGLSIRCLRDLETGLSDTQEKDNRINIYPNPTKDKINLEIQNRNVSNPIEFVLIDLHGNQLSRTIHYNSITTMDLSHLTEGLYFYQAVIGGEVVTGKIIIKN
ncbi:MAG TPA: FISUMP domain-containing protein [Bacteroidales bacterium]|nr:FISUMP domain-containing protein [Bacteroidales bacterium]